MEFYSPSISPDPDEWLSTDEGERLRLVTDFHELEDKDLDEAALNIHSAIHVIVENQLALGVELLPETVARLTRQGLTRHEALHAIGAIISADLMAMIKGETSKFSSKKYRIKLQKITAKRWNKGQY